MIAFVNGIVWSLTIPFDGAPDEISKYDIVYFVSRHGRVPVFGPEADVYLRAEPARIFPYVSGMVATYPVGAHLGHAVLPWG